MNDVTAHAHHPAIAQAPTHCVIGMQFRAGTVVGRGVAAVEVIHDFRVDVQAIGVDVRHRHHGFDYPVIASDVGQVIAIVFTRRRNEIHGDNTV
ncbi:hypothetical protein D3C84_1133350 [compost metagenome]